MKIIINVIIIVTLLNFNAFTQKYYDDNVDGIISGKASKISPGNSNILENYNQLISIDLVANSGGPIVPNFIYKGVVDIDATPLVLDPVLFTSLINGNSMSSISPDDNGQFYVSQSVNDDLSRMISFIENAKTPIYELRFESDNAGLSLDAFVSESIHRVPFTAWDLNGTPADPNDDIQLLALTLPLDDDTTWGFKSGNPASWTANPAQESDWIYIYSFIDGVTYSDFETAYQQQVSTGIVDPFLYDNFVGQPIIRRITINSLDINPLTTINSFNGFLRPAPGTVIRWTIFIDLNIVDEDLYGVVGEPFNYIVNATGWPIPTLSPIQLPAWLTIGNNLDIYGTPGISDWGSNTIGIQASNTQGTAEGWYHMWVDEIPWNQWDHNNNNIVSSVFNVGKMGAITQDEGSGFQFNGPNGLQNGLYDGELIIALSDSQSSGGLFTDRINHDFATISPLVSIPGPLAGFDQAFWTEYNDSRNVSPLGVKVICQSYSKPSFPDDDYVILDYEIYNENPTALNGVYIALFTDWDVGDARFDLGGYDAARKLNFIYEENGVNNSNYYGTSLLLGDLSGNAFHADYDDSIRFYQMFSFEPPSIQAEDQFTMIASGPYNIAPNEAIRVVFAIIGGTDLADIRTNADAASNVNLNRRPAQIAPLNGSTGISINPTLTWTEIYGASEYGLQLATDFNFTNIIRDNTGTFTTFQYSGLDPEMTYFWRVRAIYGSDFSDWSNVWSFTTYALTELILQNATNMTDVSATLNGEVNPNGHEVAVGFEFGEDNSYGNFVTASPDTFNGTVNQFVYADVSGLRTNWDYHFRVVVNQVDGEFSVFGIDQVFHTQSYPTTINLSMTFDFPSHENPTNYSATDYRIIGLPGVKDPRLDLTNILTGEHKIAWQAYWDNGTYSDNHNDYLIEFDGSGIFRLGGGNAVWLINKGNFNINISGIPTMPTDGDDNVRVDLHNGWNMITSPFIRQVTWWEVQQANSISNPIYEFSGGWNTSDHLNPFQGYLFDNVNNLTELIVPYRATLPKQTFKNDYDWRIKIALKLNELFDNSSYLGVSEQSEIGRDDLDFKKPRGVGSIPYVYFNRPQWDKNYSTFATDIRPPFNEFEKWEFQVSANPGIKVDLKFAEVESVPSNYEVVLIDRVYSKYHDLRKDNSYQFIPVTETTTFEILVGYEEYIQEEISSILPLEFSLGRNFPNPFNPSTVIPISLPQQSDISLKVYDMLGKEIKTIFNGNKEAGNHYFSWNGTNEINQQVAAGIYLYRLNTSEGHNFVGKMVLVK